MSHQYMQFLLLFFSMFEREKVCVVFPEEGEVGWVFKKGLPCPVLPRPSMRGFAGRRV